MDEYAIGFWSIYFEAIVGQELAMFRQDWRNSFSSLGSLPVMKMVVSLAKRTVEPEGRASGKSFMQRRQRREWDWGQNPVEHQIRVSQEKNKHQIHYNLVRDVRVKLEILESLSPRCWSLESRREWLTVSNALDTSRNNTATYWSGFVTSISIVQQKAGSWMPRAKSRLMWVEKAIGF